MCLNATSYGNVKGAHCIAQNMQMRSLSPAEAREGGNISCYPPLVEADASEAVNDQANLSNPMRKLLPFIVIGFGAVMLLLGGGTLLFNQAVRSPGVAPLPSQVANQRMTIKNEGWQAIDEFSRLHQQEFPLTAGAVGVYGLKLEAKLWVGEALFKFMANQMVTEMRDKIAEGNSPFTPTEERQQAGRTIYVLDGMGQKHFYFHTGKLIVWLAANEDLAERALQDTLEFYP